MFRVFEKPRARVVDTLQSKELCFLLCLVIPDQAWSSAHEKNTASKQYFCLQNSCVKTGT